MDFVCDCGFRAELSAEQRQRLAASGGRAKCPKCGKIITPRIPNGMAVESPQISAAHGNKIEDLLGLKSDAPSPPVAEPEQVSRAGTNVGALEAGKWKQRLPLVLSSIALLTSVGLMVFGRDSDKSGLVKRIERQEEHIKELDELVLKFENAKSKGSMVAQDRAEFQLLEADMIRCKTFGVVDQKGKIRFVIGVNDKHVQLSLASADEKPRVSLIVEDGHRAVMEVTDTDGKMCSLFGVGKTDSSTLLLLDSGGKPKHMLVAE